MLDSLKLRDDFNSLFARVPARVLANRKLMPVDRDVYGAIALCMVDRLRTQSVTQTQIAVFLGVSIRTVKYSISRLLMEREIEVKRDGRGVNVYRLTSPLFARKSAGVKCSHCQIPCRRLPQTGVCRKCARELVDEQRVREALAILGPGASDEQLARHCEVERITPRWLRIRRRIERAA